MDSTIYTSTVKAHYLAKAKTALRTKTTDTSLVEQIEDLCEGGLDDLTISGVSITSSNIESKLIVNAVMCYVRMHFGSPDDLEKIKTMFEMQKAQLMTATGYTLWEETTANG